MKIQTHFYLLILIMLIPAVLAANTAIEPVPKGPKWLERHQEMTQRAEEKDIQLLLLGDSITDYWDKRAEEVYRQTFGKYKTANFGISADRTQHLLWRLQNGIGAGYSPEFIVLLIGTNNTGFEKDRVTPRNSTAEVIHGIIRVVSEIRTRFPDSPLLMFGLFPRGTPDNPQRDQIRQINEAIMLLANDQDLFFEDIGQSFLDDKSNIPEELMPDKLHPSAEGYKIWAKALTPYLEKFLR